MKSFCKSSITKNTSALFVLQILNYVFPLILLPYLTRILGIQLFGIYVFSISIIQLSTIVTDYGFNLSATYAISKNRYDQDYVNTLIGAVYLIKLVLLSLIWIVLIIFVLSYSKYEDHRLFLSLCIIPIAGMTFQPIWFFQGIERMKYITLYTGLAKFSYVVLVILLVKRADQIVNVALANGVAQIGAAVIGWYLIVRLGYSPKVPSRTFLKKTFMESLPFFWSRAAVATYTTAGSFYLGIFAAPTQVAIFSASEQLYKAAQNAFMPLIQSLYPFMANKPDFPLFFRILAAVTIFTTMVCGIGYYFSPIAIKLIYGNEFSSAYGVFKIFLVMMILTVPSMMLGYPFLGALGKANLANTSVIIAGILQIILLSCLYFMNLVSAVWVAVSIIIVELAVLLLRIKYGLNNFKLSTQ